VNSDVALHFDVNVAGGRSICWQEQGDPAGRPVLSLHGAPGSRLASYPYPDKLSKAGVRLITYDRPGYGRSDPHPGRTVADAAGDVRHLLDHLELDRVGVTGRSGGGPHALALATLLPDRCTVVHCVVGVAPITLMGEAFFFGGMDPENIRRFREAQRGRDQAAVTLGADLSSIVGRAQVDPATIAGAMELPEEDRALLRTIGSFLAAGIIESGHSGPWGFVDDFIAFANDWGFDPRDAAAPVVITYGEYDVNVPSSHGRWLADQVPNLDVRVHREGGHLVPPDEALAQLVEIASAG
jgi:pimeloyl-ACP methyl ester carboxylesterase